MVLAPRWQRLRASANSPRGNAGPQEASELTLRPHYNATKGFDEPVSFREDPRVLNVVDGLARRRGSDRSALYREAIRYWLEEKEHIKLDSFLGPKEETTKLPLSQFVQEANKAQLDFAGKPRTGT